MKGFIKRPKYRAKKVADKDSHIWDRLIEIISNDFQTGNIEVGDSLIDLEQTLRIMAREDRFSRRVLGKSFLQFMELAQQGKVRSRLSRSPSGVPYVFLARPHGEDRNTRRKELRLRCFVARGLHSDQAKAIGIATEVYELGKGFSLDVCLFSKDNWTSKDQSLMESLQSELGYFKKPIKTYGHEDEYPNPLRK